MHANVFHLTVLLYSYFNYSIYTVRIIFTLRPASSFYIKLTVRGKAGGDPASQVSVTLPRGVAIDGILFSNVVAPPQVTAPATKKEARVGRRIVGEIVSVSTVFVLQTVAAATVLVQL